MGPYRLEAVLGEGGMGRVYLGRTPAGSAVAVKLVHREYAADPVFRKRFAQEVATARRVQGLYTVPVVDADVQVDEPWLATAYIPGPSLQHAVTEHGPLPVETTLTLIAQVAEALQSIHATGVIHRDLKPSNVILTADGPKVIDFGIARAADLTSVTGTGVRPGTPAYMAPEHILGHPLTPAADVFALGVLAHFTATGELAFGGGSAPAVIHRIVELEPRLDDCPEPIRSVVTACLTKDPQRRPTLADVIARCRQAASAGGDGHAPPSPPSPPPASLAALTKRDTEQGTGHGTPAVPPRPRTPQHAPTKLMPQRLSRRRSLLILIAGAAGAAGIGAIARWEEGPAQPQGPAQSQGPAQPPRVLLGVTEVKDVAFSPDGRTLASSSTETIKLWDVAGRQELATLVDQATVLSGLSGLAFSPDGRTLATSSVVGLNLWDVARRKQVATLRGPVESVAFSPDGRTLATAESDVTLWDVAGRRRVATLRSPENDAVTAPVGTVAFSPDGRTLSAALGDPVTGGPVTLWDVARRRQIATLTGHDSGAFSPDGRIFAVATDGGRSVMLWDVARHRQLATLADHEGESSLFEKVMFSPDGRTLASSGGSAERATMTLWDVAGRRPVTTWVIRTGDPSGNVRSMAFSPDGRTLATGSESELNLWDVAD